MLNFFVFLVLIVPSFSNGSLTESVGPVTSSSAKRSKICSILDYGGSVDSNDIGPAILRAFNDCVLKNPGSTLYIPPGNYSMQTWVTLKKGTKWALQLDGLITRTSTGGGNMIAISEANDFEFYSSTSAGGIQGNGYQCRNVGIRLLRIINSTNFSVHDVVLVDSPSFHLVLDTCTRGEVYNMAIRGPNMGGTDGINVWGKNLWIHDVEVTNRDECVTVKSPSSNILVEQIWCNQSGGSAIGSLGAGTFISNITYDHIYTNGGNHAYMIKSNGGSGIVSDVVLQNFIFTGSAHGLYFNQYWSSMTEQPGDGVQLSNIRVANWTGVVSNGVSRPPIDLHCAAKAPCTDISFTNVNMWSNTGVAIAQCENAFGSGIGCISNSSTPTGYGPVRFTMTKASDFSIPVPMVGDLAAGFPPNSPIPLPKIPESFFPGLGPKSPLGKDAIASTPAPISKRGTKASDSSNAPAMNNSMPTIEKHHHGGGKRHVHRRDVKGNSRHHA